MMDYDEKYFETEIREGFKITSMMKRFWAASLEVLKEIDRVCKKNDIQYILYFGSLLGAVRHKGFIPWDDDLDIAMSRDNYKKFVEVVKSDLSPDFYLQHFKRDSCLYPGSIINTFAPQIDNAFLERFHGCPYSAGVDVFPLDNWPDDPKKRNNFEQIYLIIRYLAIRTDPRFSKDNIPEVYADLIDNPTKEDIEEVLEGVEKYLNRKIVRDDLLHEHLTEIADELSQKYNKTKSKYVGYINDLPMPGCKRGIFPKSAMEKTIDMEFEHYMFPVPVDYEEVLCCLYGDDWMKPVMNSAGHDYPVYKKQAEQLENLFKIYGAPAPEYFYL